MIRLCPCCASGSKIFHSTTMHNGTTLEEPQVLWVLASGLNDRVFDEKGARAIIELAWAEASLGQKITFTLAFWPR